MERLSTIHLESVDYEEHVYWIITLIGRVRMVR